MGYLLDTHCFLWAIKQPDRLSKRIASLLTAGNSQILLSAASLWEIAIKAGAGRLDVPREPEFFARHMDVLGLQPLAVQTWHVNRIFHLPDHHKDPFDRLLVAQALVEDLTILTADPAIGRYDVKTLW